MNQKSKALTWMCVTLLAAGGAAALAHPSTQPAAAQTTQPAFLIDPNFSFSDAAEFCFYQRDYELAIKLFKTAAARATDPKQRASLQQRIRDCERAIASKVPTSPEKRVPHKLPPAGATLDISLEELGNFDYDSEKGGGMPADVKALNGAKVRIHGYMVPMDSAENIRKLDLVPYVWSSSSGPPAPPMQNTIIVDCPQDKPVDYCPDEIIVEGTLNVEEKKEDGFIVSVFQIAGASVRPVPKSK